MNTYQNGLRRKNYTPRIEVDCANCGKKILKTPSSVNMALNHYCNDKCRIAGHKREY